MRASLVGIAFSCVLHLVRRTGTTKTHGKFTTFLDDVARKSVRSPVVTGDLNRCHAGSVWLTLVAGGTIDAEP
jgi:hypothetical protein